MIIYPQQPSDIVKKLPPSIDEITSLICVLFIGAHPLTNEWLTEKAKPLAVRDNKVHQALLWLKANNRLYKDLEIDEHVLAQLEHNPVLPFHIEHIMPSEATHRSTSGYDPSQASHSDCDGINVNATNCDNAGMDVSEIPFSSVVITDVENVVGSSQLAAAAV